MEGEIEPMSQADELMMMGRLSNGRATQEDRDKAALASLLEIRAIKNELWKPEDLRRYIREEHSQLCRSCPTRLGAAQKSNEDASPSNKALMLTLKIIGGLGIAGFVICLLLMGVKFAEIVQAASQFHQ